MGGIRCCHLDQRVCWLYQCPNLLHFSKNITLEADSECVVLIVTMRVLLSSVNPKLYFQEFLLCPFLGFDSGPRKYRKEAFEGGNTGSENIKIHLEIKLKEELSHGSKPNFVPSSPDCYAAGLPSHPKLMDCVRSPRVRRLAGIAHPVTSHATKE